MAGDSLLRAAWQMNRVAPAAILVLLLVNGLLFAWLSYFELPRVEALERRFIAKQAQVREIRKEGVSLETPQQIYLRGIEDLEKFWQAVPPREEFTALIGEIFSLADEADLAIDRVAYEPVEDSGRDLLLYGLQFSVAGDYGQIKKFIYLLEQSRRLISIDEISLATTGGTGQQEVNLRIGLTTFFSSRNRS